MKAFLLIPALLIGSAQLALGDFMEERVALGSGVCTSISATPTGVFTAAIGSSCVPATPTGVNVTPFINAYVNPSGLFGAGGFSANPVTAADLALEGFGGTTAIDMLLTGSSQDTWHYGIAFSDPVTFTAILTGIGNFGAQGHIDVYGDVSGQASIQGGDHSCTVGFAVLAGAPSTHSCTVSYTLPVGQKDITFLVGGGVTFHVALHADTLGTNIDSCWGVFPECVDPAIFSLTSLSATDSHGNPVRLPDSTASGMALTANGYADLAAVPEPATFVPLGLAIVVIASKRNRSSFRCDKSEKRSTMAEKQIHKS